MKTFSDSGQARLIGGKREALVVVLVYGVIAALWIRLGDAVLLRWTDSVEAYQQAQTYKGWLFVVVTGVLLYWLLYRFVETVQGWESAVHVHRERLRQVFDSVATAVAITDTRGRYTYVNPAYCQLFGYSSEELLGRDATLTGLDGELPERSPRGTLDYVRDHKTGWCGEALRVDKRGRVIPVFVSVSPLKIDERLYGFLGELVDLRSIKDWPPHLGGFALSLHRLSVKPTFEEMGAAAVAEAVAVVGGDVGLIALRDDDGMFVVRWSVGFPPKALPPKFRPRASFAAAAVARGQPLIIDDIQEGHYPLPLIPGVDLRAAVAVPIGADGDVDGVLMVGHLDRPYAFAESHASMLDAIASQVEAGLERERVEVRRPGSPRIAAADQFEPPRTRS